MTTGDDHMSTMHSTSQGEVDSGKDRFYAIKSM